MLDELKAFVLLAETGSVQRVAERLLLTQPAVTRQVQRLERMLDATLLDRRAKPATFTRAGVVALERARAILASVDELKQVLASDAEPAGQLRLGVAHTLATAELAEAVESLRQHYPNLALQLVSGWTPELAAKVEQGTLDAAILLSAGDAGSLAEPAGRIVGTEDVLIIAPKALRVPKRATLAALADHGWILMPDETCGARRALRTAIERQGGQFLIAAEVHDIELQISLVSKGLGVGIMPRRKLTAGLKQKLQIVDVGDPQLRLSVFVKRAKYLSGINRGIDFLEEELIRIMK
ncbi:LysR family transcriptional regulator [Bosea sp. BIWAKO-01]|uniref:LysR family transcriptional regulator n=1 Tax=Bosea sp. BIWAKO-01 TaxID=506668 RepID=UPI00086E2EA4|nr:LysR family transcriptional regulator [Bosea sp. BIWAKO-01]GAU80549.1 transcriptional regulatory protein [Bosea sp. BIWAKO-01]